MPEHKDIVDAERHEPKGASTAASGQIIQADGLGGTSWINPSSVFSRGTLIGFADYNDAATSTTPLSVTGGAGYVTIPNDTLGAQTTTAFLPEGVTTVYNPLTNEFDWEGAGLRIGDMLDLRLDIEVTTTVANQFVEVDLELGIGTFPYDIHMGEQVVKAASTVKFNRYNGIYIGNTETLEGGARFKIQSDGNCTVVVSGWYVKALINR